VTDLAYIDVGPVLAKVARPRARSRFSHTLKQDVEVPHPPGISGGPLAIGADLGSLRLVGLPTRYRASREDEWCEPVLEAVRLLVDHDDASVSAEARRLVRELVPSP